MPEQPRPSCWTPPQRLPDDLPPHEVWVREVPWTLAGAPSPHPPVTAPGFQRAKRLGLLPPDAPATPPAPLSGPSSVQTLLAMAGVVLLVVVLARPSGRWIPVLALGSAVVLWRLYRYLLSRDEAEEAAGYTHFAGATGLWRISPFTGRVTREPDRSVPPSGFYPSPYFPGVLQRWDGPGWAFLEQHWWRPRVQHRYFRRPEVDFLDGLSG